MQRLHSAGGQPTPLERCSSTAQLALQLLKASGTQGNAVHLCCIFMEGQEPC